MKLLISALFLSLVHQGRAAVAGPEPSGLGIELQEWLRIPPSHPSSSTRARINHVKPEPGGPRLFCNDLRGEFWLIRDSSATNAELFADLRTLTRPGSTNLLFPHFIDSPGLGAGFTSFAFHPEFLQEGASGYGVFYTAHMEQLNGDADFRPPGGTLPGGQTGIISEWVMDDPASDALLSSPANFSVREVLRIDFSYVIHTLQEISFNPNAVPGEVDYGCLYVCVGDGGAVQLEQSGNAGRIDAVYGTILRIAPRLTASHDPEDFKVSSNSSYFIPVAEDDSNPFVGADDPTPGDGHEVVEEIFAYGFRNPHRISWDTGGTGKMFCGAIGEAKVEEVELIEKGGHYGWPFREGAFTFSAAAPGEVTPLPMPDEGPVHSPPEPASFSYPVAQYDHDIPRLVNNSGIAVAGGYVYRGTRIPYLVGKYICGDVAQGWIYIADEAEMRLQAPASTGDAPATLEYLEILNEGVPTTLGTMVESSRVDLRFGLESDGELLVLSKQNGAIYRVLPAGATGVNAGTMEDWDSVTRFDQRETPVVVRDPSTPARLSMDPNQDPRNVVLELENVSGEGPEPFLLPIPAIADGQTGTVFFRFFLASDQTDVLWGISDSTAQDINSVSAENLVVAFERRPQDSVVSYLDSAANRIPFAVNSGEWYSVWVVVENAPGDAGDRATVYVSGGRNENPTLAVLPSPVRSGSSGALASVLGMLQPGSDSIFLDDVFVDPEDVNLTQPDADSWTLIDNFQQGELGEGWYLDDPNRQRTEVVVDGNDNGVLAHRAAGEGTDNTNAVAGVRLPRAIPVGARATLYFRFLLDHLPASHEIGVTTIPSPSQDGVTRADLETSLRISGDVSPVVASFFDGSPGVKDYVDFNQALFIETNRWYEAWMVVRDGGFASGGQEYDVYVRGDGEGLIQPVARNLVFRNIPELSLTHLVVWSSTGVSGVLGSGGIHIDDIYLRLGEHPSGLFDPVVSRLSYNPTSAEIEFTWTTVGGWMYEVQRSGGWDEWAGTGLPVEGDGLPQTYREAGLDGAVFFRIRAAP